MPRPAFSLAASTHHTMPSLARQIRPSSFVLIFSAAYPISKCSCRVPQNTSGEMTFLGEGGLTVRSDSRMKHERYQNVDAPTTGP